MDSFFRLNDTFARKFSVTFENIDPDYRLTITSAIAFFQDTVAAFMTSRHVAAFDVIKKDIIWVVSDIIFYAGQKQAMWLDDVTAEINLTEISSFRIFFDCNLKGNDGSVFCSCTGVWAPVSHETGKPIPITDFCQILEPEEGAQPVRHEKLRNMKTIQQVSEASYPVTHGELDFNKHMGNRSYIDFALRGVPEEVLNTHSIKKIMVKYEKQTFLGDILTCKYFSTEVSENIYMVRICNSEGEQACLLMMEWTPGQLPSVDISKTVKRI